MWNGDNFLLLNYLLFYFVQFILHIVIKRSVTKKGVINGCPTLETGKEGTVMETVMEGAVMETISLKLCKTKFFIITDQNYPHKS